MKRFTRASAVALAAMMVMALAVAASHSTWVSFGSNATLADASTNLYTTTEGETVTVIANSSEADNAPKLQLHVCQAATAGVPVTPATYVSYQTCAAAIAAADGSAVWVLMKEQADNTTVASISESFNTTGLAGQTAGFRSWREPGPNVHHPDAQGFANLFINPLPSGGGGEHPGCKGVENAYSQVSTNNGSAKGKGGEALEKVAAKLGCDLAP
jgi:hypothetical protein